MHLVFLDGVAQPGIGFLQSLSFLFREVRILKSRQDVIEFRFQLLQLCTEHRDLHFLRGVPEATR